MIPDSVSALSSNEIAGASFESSVGVVGHGSPGNLVNNAIDSGGNVYNLNDGVGDEVVIDLNATTQVDRVRLFQRPDCCQNRLADVTVSLLADNGSGLPGAEVRQVSYPSQPPVPFAETEFPNFAPGEEWRRHGDLGRRQ